MDDHHTMAKDLLNNLQSHRVFMVTENCFSFPQSNNKTSQNTINVKEDKEAKEGLVKV